MPNLNNIKIGAKLAGNFGILIVAGLFIAATGMLALHHVSQQVHQLTDRHMQLVSLLGNIKMDVDSIAISVRNIALTTEPELLLKEKDNIHHSRLKIRDQLNRFEGKSSDPLMTNPAADLKRQMQAYDTQVDKAITLSETGGSIEAGNFLVNQLEPVQKQYLDRLDKQILIQMNAMQRSVLTVDDASADTSAKMLLAAILATLTGLCITVLTTRSITRPMQNAIEIARHIRNGQLNRDILISGTDETSQMLQAISDMQAELRKLVRIVRQNAENLADRSVQIAADSARTAQIMSQQSSDLANNANRMGSLASSASSNSNHALSADTSARQASGIAQHSGALIDDVVQTMNSIFASSKQIASVIAEIDSIAFQTNILALNAAIEAAHAGDAGRGFAVVANEVRQLAKRSSESARQISALVGVNVHSASQGASLVGEAGRAIASAVAAAREVSEIVNTISQASITQHQEISAANQVIREIDQRTRQTSEVVRDSLASAEHLRQQAANLVKAVEVFQLEESSLPDLTIRPPLQIA